MDFLHEAGLLGLKLVDGVCLLVALFLELIFLPHEIVHCVVLTDGKTGTLFDDFVQVSDLTP